jgi:predicted nucleotidyltransferase
MLEAHRQELRALGVLKLGLFGSYRRGTAKPDSDMDFLVVFDNASFDGYMDTKFLLEDLFQCPVDLVMEKDVKPQLRPYITNEVSYVAGL